MWGLKESPIIAYLSSISSSMVVDQSVRWEQAVGASRIVSQKGDGDARDGVRATEDVVPSISVLFRQAAGGVALRAAGAVTAVGLQISVARALGPDQYGLYATVMAYALLFGTIATLGWPALATREAAGAIALGNMPRVKGLVCVGLITATATGLLISLTIILAAGTEKIDAGILQNATPVTVILGSFLIPLLALSLVRAGLLRGLRRVLRADAPDLLLRPVLVLALVLLVGLDLTANGVESLLFYQMAATVLAAGIGLVFLYRAVSVPCDVMPPHGWFRKAMPFWLISQIGLLLAQTPLYLLGMLEPASEVGLFAIAAQFAGVIGMCIVSIEMPLQGRLAEAWAVGDRAKAEQLARAASRLALVVAALCSMILIVFAKEVLLLVGTEYRHAVPTMRILVFGQFVFALSGTCRIALSMSGQELVVLYGVSFGLAMTALMGSAVIPGFGAVGAAAAVVVGTTLLNLYFLIACWRKLGISTSPLLPARQQ